MRLSIALVLAGALAVACGDAGSGADESAGALAAVPITSIKTQQIGNCWAYSTAAWVESLHKGATGEELNVSEAYITYWSWLLKITSDNAADADEDELKTGAYWGAAVEIMRRYGVYTGSFIPGDKQLEAATRQQTALDTVNASLQNGPMTTLEARRDKALVRRELNRAWRLPDDLVAKLDRAFGADGQRTFLNTAAKSGLPLLLAADLSVRSRNPKSGALEVHSLADVVGARRQGGAVDERSGPLAWTRAPLPSRIDQQRGFLRRIQRALHDGTPVPFSWNVDLERMQADGAFAGKTTRKLGAHGHLSLLIDYQVRTPGFGVLPAGKPETRPDALAAALSNDAQIEFLRIKNSWGTDKIKGAPQFMGTNDLGLDYLLDTTTVCDDLADPATCSVRANLKFVILPPET